MGLTSAASAIPIATRTRGSYGESDMLISRDREMLINVIV